MLIQCTDNSGFEDLLTTGAHYTVLDLQGSSVRLTDDSGQARWYGRLKFSEPSCARCESQQAA